MRKIGLVLLAITVLISCAAVQKAPDFTLTNIKGDQISLSGFAGQKAVLLLFTNFQTGGGQDPLLQGYLTRYQPAENLETLMIGNWSVLPEEVKQYKTGNIGSLEGVGTAALDKDGSVSRAYRASPDKVTLVLVDREGQIRFRQEDPPPVEDNRDLSNQIAEITR